MLNFNTQNIPNQAHGVELDRTALPSSIHHHSFKCMTSLQLKDHIASKRKGISTPKKMNIYKIIFPFYFFSCFWRWFNLFCSFYCCKATLGARQSISFTWGCRNGLWWVRHHFGLLPCCFTMV